MVLYVVGIMFLLSTVAVIYLVIRGGIEDALDIDDGYDIDDDYSYDNNNQIEDGDTNDSWV